MSKEKGVIEIRIAGLSEGIYEYDFTCKASDFKNPELAEPGFCNEIDVKVVANKTDNEIIVDIVTKTVAELTCDICLAPLKKEVAGTYRVFFVFDEPGSNTEGLDENFRILDRNASGLDLTEDVRETLLLSKPLKVVCTGNPECSVYHDDEPDSPEDEPQAESPWQESLKKLKNKYH
ncbi:hypothetical protein CR164_04070 [Prosthecochloris marina]|uniref:DUF177 domain-containing protein n=1 Tax=Prosthecochloris marina TaxID=2017681 RepID=A0A317TAN4_9CHLB|nr:MULTISPECIES: DUF177 domain-containing protein [Prosthecochloris]PWW82917.1 hypothetical protein CR164_04070 [Prosthecochloris marina]